MRDRGCDGLVDEAEDFEPGERRCVFGRAALGVVEICAAAVSSGLYRVRDERCSHAGTATTACLTFRPRCASASAFSLPSTAAEISSGVFETKTGTENQADALVSVSHRGKSC